MATLPDNTTHPSLPDGPQKPWFDADTMPGDAETGANDHSVWTSGVAPFDDALRQAEADAKHAVVLQTWQQAIREENDPSKILAYGPVFQAANAERAAVFTDPQFGSQWAAARDAEARQLVSSRFDEVSREQTVANTDAWLDRLNAAALRSSGDDTARLIETGNRLIQGLKDAGHIDEAAARDRQRHWVQNYAKAWVEMRPAQERIALLGDVSTQDYASPAAVAPGGSDREVTPAFGTVADFLPPEERARIRREARAEMERQTAKQVFARTRHYEESLNKASNDPASPPPWRAAIEADPDLDDLTRTRLLKQHDAMQRKLDVFWLAKAEYDKPDGRKFSVDNAEDRDFVEQIYIRLGAAAAALHAVVNRTGILPDSARSTMLGDIASGDPARVGRTVEQLMRLGQTYPNVRLYQENDEDLQYALTQFRHEISQGNTPEEAIRSIIKSRSSEPHQNLAGDALDALVVKATSPSDLKHLVGTNPIVTAALFAVYPELVKERLAVIDNISLARAQALDQANLLVEFANSPDGGVPTNSPKESGAEPISPAERERLHERIAYFDTFIGMMKFARWMEVKASIDAGLDGDQLIAKHAPGLNTRGQEARRQAELEYFKEIPKLYDAAMADRAKYDAMPPASTDEERVAAATGYAKGSVGGIEKLFGPTRFARLAMMSALRNRLPVSGGPAAHGPSGGSGVPHTSGWWQTASPAQVQALNNDALRAGMVIAGAPPLQPTPDGVADRGGRSSAQPGRPSDEDLGLPPPPPVAVPSVPASPVSRPTTDSSTQSKADEREEEEEKWGVYFFDQKIADILVSVPRPSLGLPGQPQFFMPLEDSSVVVDAASAWQYTGAAPSVDRAYRSGGSIYGVKFPLKGRTYRVPTSIDAQGHEHFREGGHTAIRHPDGTYTVNWNIHEFVTPGGDLMPQGAELFVLEQDGARKILRTW